MTDTNTEGQQPDNQRPDEHGSEPHATASPPTIQPRAAGLGERTRYAYLFHLWAEPCRGKEPLWRFSLEEVETGVRHGFGNWDALATFLHQRMASE